MQRIQNVFIWNNLTPKIRHEILCNFFEEVDLKNVDMNSKVASLQCSWIKRLSDGKFHEWKLIPVLLIKSTFRINFMFHSSLDFDDSKILTFPSFSKQLFHNWHKYLSSSINIRSSILSRPIWYNKNGIGAIVPEENYPSLELGFWLGLGLGIGLEAIFVAGKWPRTNKNIKIKGKPIYVEEFAKQNIIFLRDLFNTAFKTWDKAKISYNLSDKSFFR